MKPIGYIATTPWGHRRVLGTSAASAKDSHAVHLKRPGCNPAPGNENPAPCVWSLILGILSAERSEPTEQQCRYGKRRR
jgi:hypothetical protein